ncbi:non-hydrolyzing UDP-N-acetylglucosamine 2-epimerase [Brucellaceae bacterium C25G]
MTKCVIHLIAGTRPNVMKIAPLYKALKKQSWCQPRIIFLEQHTSANMGAGIFKQLGVDDDVTRLQLKTGDLGDRLGSIISTYSNILIEDKPHLVVVPGDVDVSLGAAIAAKRCHCTVAHLEAGLRSNDRRMPEELNRILIDSISDILLAPSEAAAETLIYKESMPSDCVHFVGNIMIDSLKYVLDENKSNNLMEKYNLETNDFSVVTFHRPSNVDNESSLDAIIDLLSDKLAKYKKVVFPVHPRTKNNLTPSQMQKLSKNSRIQLIPPLAYDEFINIVAKSALVVTDSGGIQEETSYLKVPCFTLRETTERPITTIIGTNTLVSLDDVEYHIEALAHRKFNDAEIPLWDGYTAYRCAHIFNTWWRKNIMLMSS